MPSGAGFRLLERLHSRTPSSAPPAARMLPSGLNATEFTLLPGLPRTSLAQDPGLAPVTFHSRIRPSAPPAARNCPVRLNATELTLPIPGFRAGPRDDMRCGP